MSWHSSREAKVWMANKNKFLSYPSNSLRQSKSGVGELYFSIPFFLTKILCQSVHLLCSSKTWSKKDVFILNSLNIVCQHLSQVLITPPHAVVVWAFCSASWVLWHPSMWAKRSSCLLILEATDTQSEWGPRKALTELELELHRNVSYPWNILLQADIKSNLKQHIWPSILDCDLNPPTPPHPPPQIYNCSLAFP